MFASCQKDTTGLIMPKLITGIIAVICLHLGYGAYLATEGQKEGVRNAGFNARPVSDVNSNYELAEAMLPPENELFYSDIVSEPERVESRDVRVVRAVKAVTQAPARNYSETIVPESYATRRPIKVIVTDPYADKPSDQRRTIRVDQKPSANKNNDRSFIAKTVKKPYDWLKAVGSKLF